MARQKPSIRYIKEVDILSYSNGKACVRSSEIQTAGGNVILDYGRTGGVIGFEMSNATKILGTALGVMTLGLVASSAQGEKEVPTRQKRQVATAPKNKTEPKKPIATKKTKEVAKKPENKENFVPVLKAVRKKRVQKAPVKKEETMLPVLKKKAGRKKRAKNKKV